MVPFLTHVDSSRRKTTIDSKYILYTVNIYRKNKYKSNKWCLLSKFSSKVRDYNRRGPFSEVEKSAH